MIKRPRRLRRTPALRDMVRETALSVKDFIYPLFVKFGKDIKDPILSLPGQYHFSADRIADEAEDITALGIPAVLLFGLPESKDPEGAVSCREDGVVQQAIARIKERVPDLVVMTDVCLCEYTDHGHCGVIREGRVDNDATLEILARQALSHARAGADFVAPSDMMDGRVLALRRALDEDRFEDIGIMSYAAKYASAFYGPFREAADSAPRFGDRRGYQMDPANGREALKEVALDIEEGADIVMVKPGLPYLDVLYRVRQECPLPLATYNVSGEYAMVKAAGEKGWIDEEQVMVEGLLAMKRAGADLIITYFAKDAARLLSPGGR